MTVHRYGEDITGRSVDDSEAVPLPSFDVLDEEGDLRPAIEAAHTIESARVGDRNDSSGNIAVEKWDSGVVPPVT